METIAIFVCVFSAIFLAILLPMLLTPAQLKAEAEKARARRIADAKMNTRLLRLNL